jgi:uncharacterized protein involved in response to NO
MLATPPLVAALVDVAFVPVAAVPMYRVLRRSGNRRNMFLIGLLGVLTLANALFHAAVLGWIAIDPVHPIHAAIMVVVVIEVVIGGRVIPNFTANAVAGLKPVMHPRRDQLALGLTASAGLAWACGAPAPFAAGLAAAAAAAQAVRLAGWQPWRSVGNPLLWILHVSYLWIPAGFLLLAAAELGLVPLSAAVHVLALGALAGLIIGMITRTALGHTGRQLRAGLAETVMYALVQAGVVARFAAAMVPAWRMPVLVLAAACWSTAFVTYVLVYGPYLMRPRVDGREG